MSSRDVIWKVYESVRSIYGATEDLDIDELGNYSEEVPLDLDQDYAGWRMSVASLSLSASISEHLAKVEDSFYFENMSYKFEQMAQKIHDRGVGIGEGYINKTQMQQYAQFYQRIVDMRALEVETPPAKIYLPVSDSNAYEEVAKFLEDIADNM